MLFRSKSWQFIDTEMLHTILVIRRDILKVGMVCNDWKFKGKTTQRGVRCNICPIVKDKTMAGKNYMTSHANGAGFDFVSKYMSAAEMRKKIQANAHLLPYPIRLEEGVSWLHIDCYDDLSGKKVSTFKE